MRSHHGYSEKILKVDLSSGRVTRLSTLDYAGRFIGGRGLAAKLYWDEVPPDAGAFDPENCLIFATGPLAGFQGLLGSRWQLCGKSPDANPERFSNSSAAGRWGAQLKLAGWDALVVQGKSAKPVYLFIDNDTVEVRDASTLWGKGTVAVRELLKGDLGRSASVVACGPAGENMVPFATTVADDDSSASGSGAASPC